jgi:hypothetical protein
MYRRHVGTAHRFLESGPHHLFKAHAAAGAKDVGDLTLPAGQWDQEQAEGRIAIQRKVIDSG